MRLRALPAAACAMLMAACASGARAPRPSTSAPTTAPPTTAAPATTSTVAAEVAPQPSPDQASAALLDAWRRGDRATALRVASVAAVDTTFGHPAGPTTGRGCQEPVSQSSDCAFGYAGGLLVLHTVQTPSGLWVVDSVNFEG
jgi:hypothetical protein